jgi:predicted dehydrogenase
VEADFGFRPAFDPKSRLFDPGLGGGALLDLGIYPVSLASMVYGEAPRRILSAAAIGSTSVDEQSASILEFSGGRMAVISSSFRYESPQEAHIIGTDGRIRIHAPWWHLGNGYPHEAMEVMECLQSGKLESSVMPLEETLRIMQILDAIRGEWGLRYPGE